MNNSDSFNELIQSLTIPVSEMFRDPTYFLAIRENVIPFLKTYPSIKIWVAGCSTGEEVYSLAILLREEGMLERTAIYATDINPKSLKRAEQGLLSSKVIAKFEKNYQKAGGMQPLSNYYSVVGNDVMSNRKLERR